MLKFDNYGQERDRIATETEIEIFERIKTMSGNSDLELVRKSDDYVSVVLGDWDVARIKYTPRAKWLMFPTIEAKQAKHYIDGPEETSDFADLIAKTLEHIVKYQ